jgi:tRNA pseudouridine38-40 synthase
MQLKLTLEYDGTAFEGWQVQATGRTVQGEVERALATLLRAPVRVRGAGRTDAGVHASGQVAAVRIDAAPQNPGRFRASLNGILPPDVAVVAVEVAPDDFDPRRHARRRRYLYRIWNAPARTPLWSRLSWHVPWPLDREAMAAAASRLVGVHDLESFRAADRHPPATTVREIFVSRIDVCGNLIVYTIEATAFLKHMVRNVVGTVVEIGRGARAVADLEALLAARDRQLAAATAPPHGLVLAGVEY